MQQPTSRPTNSYVYFWKPSEVPYGWLSNWSAHAILEDGVRFPTMEHYFMYHKALTMGDADSASRILRAKHPKDAKAMGREVRNWDERKWVQKREEIMFRGLLLKAQQHDEEMRSLLGTAGKVLAEASPHDAIWGIGCSRTDPRAASMDRWVGKNLLGNAWMKVREILL